MSSRRERSGALVLASVLAFGSALSAGAKSAEQKMNANVVVNRVSERASIQSALDHSVISVSLARELHIERGRPAAVTDGMLNEVQGVEAVDATVRLGGVSLRDLHLVILPDEEIARLARSTDVRMVLGADLYRGRIIAFNFSTGLISVEDGVHACSGAAYVHNVGRSSAVDLPVVDVRVGGSPAKALIDPGLDDALVLARAGATARVTDAKSRRAIGGRVNLAIGRIHHNVQPYARPDTPGLVTVPYVLGREAFGPAVLTVDFNGGHICVRRV